MRLLWWLVGAVVVAVAAVLLTLFALENTQVVSLSFFGAHFSGNIWWLVLGAAAIGFLLALVLVVPGRMATSYRAANLSQLNAQHERDLAALRTTQEQLQAQRDQLTTEHARAANDLRTSRDELAAARSDRDEARRERDQIRDERDRLQSEMSQLRAEREGLVAERDQLHQRLAATPEAPVTTGASHAPVGPAVVGAATGVAGDRVAEQRDMARKDEVVASGAPAQTAAPMEPATHMEEPVIAAPANTSQDQVVAREPVVTQPASPTLGERMRAMVTGRPVDEVQAEDSKRDETRADTQTDEPVMPASQPVEAQPAEDREMPDRLAAEPVNQAKAAAQAPTDTVDTGEGGARTAGVSEPVNATVDETQAQQEQPTLGERLRALFAESHHEETAPPPAEPPQPE